METPARTGIHQQGCYNQGETLKKMFKHIHKMERCPFHPSMHFVLPAITIYDHLSLMLHINLHCGVIECKRSC